MIKQYKIPTILGLIVLVAGILAGIFLVQNTQLFRLTASVEETPKNVKITNITASSFTVSWITDKETTGFVAYGGSASLGQTTSKDQGRAVSLHHETVTGLSPSITYFFKIAAGGRLFDNNGSPYQIKTAPSLPQAKEQELIFGVVKNQTGQPEEGSIVYIALPGSSPLSATTDKTGQWLINLADTRTSDLSAFAQYDQKASILEIFAQGKGGQFATAKVRATSTKPVPDITLGKTYDFTQQEPAQPGEVPRSTLELPQQTKQPRFPVEPLATPSPTPTPSPSATPKPSLSPTPSPTPIARVAIPSTESGVPVAGDLTGTITLSIMGLMLVFTGLFLPKFLKS